MVDLKTIQTYNTKAQDYVEVFSRETPDQDLLNFFEAVKSGGVVLDFGCGPGNSSAMMKTAGFQVDAMDASEKMVEVARSKFNVEATIATFDDLNTTNHYDGIWANFSLLHAPKSEMPKHLSAIHLALKPNGHFHIGMKLGNGEKRDQLDRMYTYYEEAELKSLLEDAGFTIRNSRCDEAAGMAGNVEPFIIITANA